MKLEIFQKRYFLVKLFLWGDRDNSGYLDKIELKRQLEMFPEEGFDELFKSFDLNCDGKISLGNKFYVFTFFKILLTK